MGKPFAAGKAGQVGTVIITPGIKDKVREPRRCKGSEIRSSAGQQRQIRQLQFRTVSKHGIVGVAAQIHFLYP